jgi:hypothetical protein
MQLERDGRYLHMYAQSPLGVRSRRRKLKPRPVGPTLSSRPARGTCRRGSEDANSRRADASHDNSLPSPR